MKSNLMKALGNFQETCPPLKKMDEAHNYNYIKLEHMLPIINPVLKQCGIFLYQHVESDKAGEFTIKTSITHIETGESESSSFLTSIVHENKNKSYYQELGKAISYQRRYMTMSILNLATEDNDAAPPVMTIQRDDFDQRPAAEIMEGRQPKEKNHTGGTPFPSRERQKLPWLNKRIKKGDNWVTNPIWTAYTDRIAKGQITIEDIETEYQINKRDREELEAIIIFPEPVDNNNLNY